MCCVLNKNYECVQAKVYLKTVYIKLKCPIVTYFYTLWGLLSLLKKKCM